MAGTDFDLDVVDVGAAPVDPSEPIAPPPRRPGGRVSRALVAIVVVGGVGIGGWSAVRSDRPSSGAAAVPSLLASAAPGAVPADMLPGCPGVVGGVSIAQPGDVWSAVRAHLPRFVLDMTGRTSEPGHETCGAIVRAHRSDGAQLVVAVAPTGQPGIRYVVTSVSADGVATIHLHSVLAPASIEILLSVPSSDADAAASSARSLAADLRMSS